ncbi:hypothetical protein SAMN05444158_0708 [Bradyrhizobium canariense]|uniref:Uncharacterized protein n=1 Tax=Bradyrhizobium canariense TaxID=255045 RepID=A0A1H1NP48_9BRAD|nr:hypothetical protein SAMN05444158_0708 [Bradyrhizobium canariense]
MEEVKLHPAEVCCEIAAMVARAMDQATTLARPAAMGILAAASRASPSEIESALAHHAMVWTMPPSARSAAPLVAEASFELI